MDVIAMLFSIFGPIIGLLLLPPPVFIALRGRIAKTRWFVTLLCTYAAATLAAWLASRAILAAFNSIWLLLPWFLIPVAGGVVAIMYERAVRRSHATH
ncbi:hypothetical protein KY495_15255 [Massilia sp. PAMC28688]|uniref:hypothetical protein n=1 Tax=Massilia sp. PAMC28688 TaxID=2861283 RepID=UPI001C637C9B|nr:hypothetical protein [Massilia sp. PAMC28688]QYF92120.1 hypothetical protein KY495_15255 [Massilia sp. PAMC28688]